MSHEFGALDFDKNTHKIVEKRVTSKMSGITGFGVPGINIYMPSGVSFIPSVAFCDIVRYFMENTDIEKGDPRLKLLRDLKKTKRVKGYNGPKTRRLKVKW
jgi:hypothetical protein